MSGEATPAFDRRLDLRLILSIVATGVMSFLGVVVETAMNVAFPSLQEEFGISVDRVQWVTTGYLLVLGLVVPASAFLKRRFRTRSLFVIAVAVFIAGSLLGAIAPSFLVLILGRVLQALGTGIALPLMFNIILEQAPLHRLGTIMGFGALITAMAPAVGPSFGGLIIVNFGWREIFVVTIPVLVLALIAGAWAIRESGETSRAQFDLVGWALIAVAFTALIFASNAAANSGWLSAAVLGLLALTIAGFALFARHCLRSENPLVDVRIFGNRTFVLAVGIIVIVQFLTLGQGYLIPNYAQIVLGADPFVAGLLLFPGCVLGALLAPISGRILDRFGARSPMLIGTIAIFVGMLLYAILFPRLGLVHIALIYCIHTIGQGFTSGTSMTTGLRGLSDRLRTDGNAVINTVQQLSGALGTGVTTSMIAASGEESAQQVFVLYAALAAVAIVLWSGIFSRRNQQLT